MDGEGVPLNASSSLMLEGTLRVGAQGRWMRAPEACPLLVPLTSLGRRVVACAGADSYASAAAGGPQLCAASLPPELFQAGGDGELEQDLMWP